MAKGREKILLEIIKDFDNAEKLDDSKPIKDARKKARRVNLKLPIELRRKFCHKCENLLKGRIRIKNGKKVILCGKCGNFTRIPFKQK